jgi:type IV secretion system protein VirD4
MRSATPTPGRSGPGDGPRPPGSDLGADLIAWAAGIFLAFTTVFHVGAQLAARLSGGGRFPASLADTAAAMVHLGQHRGEPAAAWAPDVRPDIGGPLLFWACVIAVLAVVVAVVVAGWIVWRRLFDRSAHPLGVKANAGFATRSDLGTLTVPAPEPGRLTLGRAGRRLLAAEPQASLAVIGPTGCGKTAGFAIPALLEWDGPVLATSVKADLLTATLAHRRRVGGKVWVYDPTRCAYQETSAWSPLETCRTWDGAMRVAAWLAEAAQPRLDSVTDGDYWYTQARKGLAPYLHAAAVSKRSMRDVVRWVDAQNQTDVEEALRTDERAGAAIAEALTSDDVARRRDAWREEVHQDTLLRMRAALVEQGPDYLFAERPVYAWPLEFQEQFAARVEIELDRKLRAEVEPTLITPLVAARSLWNKDHRLRDSVFATMENILAGYADPGVASACEQSEIDLDEWLTGNNTIYVVATAHEQARLRPVLTVLVQQAIRSAYDAAAKTKHGRLPKPCLVLLDEAGNTAPLRDLPGYASTARSHGITLVSVWQDLAQVRALYRDRAQTVLNNHRAKLFGTGIADEATLEYVSRLVGDERRTERNTAFDVTGGRRTVSEHTSYRRSAPIDVLRRIRPDDAVLVYGSELPVKLRLRPYFRDRDLQRRAGLKRDGTPIDQTSTPGGEQEADADLRR